mgnify:CR=1 FL=1
MKKIFVGILAFVFLLLIVSCGKNQGSSQGNEEGQQQALQVISNEYKYKDNIKIRYPQIENLKDKNKQTKINEIIKNNAYGYIESYSGEEIDNYDLDINYKVTLISNDLLSIQYSGYSYDEGTAHPTDQFYTINLDLKAAERLSLKSILQINKAFINEFKNAKLVSEISEDNSFLNNNTDEEWIDILNSSDDDISGAFSYLTNDAIGISLEVPHAVGDHAEYEISY